MATEKPLTLAALSAATEAPDPPEHLQPATAKWWSEVVAAFTLEEHHRLVLTATAESWDRYQQARRVLDDQGLTFLDGNGNPRTRPEVNIERDNRVAFLRGLRELDLDSEPPAEVPRPPGLASNRG